MASDHLKADLQAYLSKYDRSQALPRLVRMARDIDVKKNRDRLQEVANLAKDCYMESRDVVGLRDFTTRNFEKGVEITLDEAWASEREKKSSAELEQLQVNLGQSQNSMEKDRIRDALFKLAEFYGSQGNMQNAMKCITRSRESCQSEEDIARMCELAVRINVFRGNTAVYNAYVIRAEQLGSKLSDEHYVFFRIASALIHLEKKAYKQCATTLTKIRRRRETPADTSVANSFFTPGDLLLVTTLCALASFDRTELSELLGKPDFKILFEGEPVIKNLVQSFFDCKYARALQALGELMPRIKLDIYLASHADYLLKTIRESAIKQYTSPFLTLDLRKMAVAFQTELPLLQREISDLIIRGEIHARIDKAESVLRATHADQRASAFEHVVSMGEQFCEDTEDCLRMLSLQRNHVVVQQKHIPRPGKEDRDRDRDRRGFLGGHR